MLKAGSAAGGRAIILAMVILFAARAAVAETAADRLVAMTDDPDARVRLQLAFTLGESGLFEVPSDPRRVTALAALARRDGSDRWARAAILSSSHGIEAGIFEELAAGDGTVAAPSPVFVSELAAIIGAGGDEDSLARMFRALADAEARAGGRAGDFAAATFRGVREGFRLKGRKSVPLAAALPALIRLRDDPKAGAEAQKFLDDFAPVESAESIRAADDLLERALDRNADPGARVAALNALQGSAASPAPGLFASLISSGESDEIAIAAIGVLDERADDRIGNVLIAALDSMTPKARERATQALFARTERIAALAAALEQGRINPAFIDLQRRAHMLHSPDERVREAAARVFESPPDDGGALMDRFRPALAMQGDAEAGAVIHERRCAQCHRMGAVGFDVGPAWSSIRSNPPEKTLGSILYPSREIKPDYVDYVIETADGRVLTGIIVSATPTGVVLRGGGGAEETLLRSAIRSMRSTGISLMPEGLAEGLEPRDIADLFAFMRTAE